MIESTYRCLGFVAVAIVASAMSPLTIKGPARVIDGDTVGSAIRMSGSTESTPPNSGQRAARMRGP